MAVIGLRPARYQLQFLELPAPREPPHYRLSRVLHPLLLVVLDQQLVHYQLRRLAPAIPALAAAADQVQLHHARLAVRVPQGHLEYSNVR